MKFQRDHKIWNYYTGLFLKLEIQMDPLVVGSEYENIDSTYTQRKISGTKNMEYIM